MGIVSVTTVITWLFCECPPPPPSTPAPLSHDITLNMYAREVFFSLKNVLRCWYHVLFVKITGQVPPFYIVVRSLH